MEDDDTQLNLFARGALDASQVEQVLIKPLRHPIWTEHKARLVERYLSYFVQITHHGTYIDGFAGPQRAEAKSAWAAELVIEMRPRWLRNLFLCEIDPEGIAALRELVARQPTRERKEPKRHVEVLPGDFNERVAQVLASGRIKETEATFCLLDQRTFECHWDTVMALAKHKRTKAKVELFYFLGTKWLHRAFSGLEDTAAVEAWWGRPDWRGLADASVASIVDTVRDRFRSELGYRHVHPWPIFEAAESNAVMYYMIHTSDHDQAPLLMRRAYDKALQGRESVDQLRFDFERGNYLGEA